MKALIDLIENNQSFLVKRILHYAKLYDYTKYTSTLEEAWVMSISGLSDALVAAIRIDEKVPEIEVEHNFENNAISAFGVLEAKKHRYRGVSLKMFLSFIKYYRQAYLDLVIESVDNMDNIFKYQLWINRFFDHNEIAYIHEWTTKSDEDLISEMQMENIRMTNEKNKYLTIFESTPNPAIILDAEHRCINLNYAAQQLLKEDTNTSGFEYYSEKDYPKVIEFLPWLREEFTNFISEDISETDIEKEFDSPLQGLRHLTIKFRRMLDVSNKFEGTVIIFNDLTEYKKIEEQLRFMSFHDSLTGLYNRAYFDEELIRLASGRFNPIGLISIDIDGLKLVNDNLGHAMGDSLLMNFGRILKMSFRECDVLARMGGDEFAIIIPHCSVDIIEQACQRLNRNIMNYNESQTDLPMSISMGWSIKNLQMSTNISEIIKEADVKMYAEKPLNHSKYVDIFKEWLSNVGKI